jgi:hypothetical protein
VCAAGMRTLSMGGRSVLRTCGAVSTRRSAGNALLNGRLATRAKSYLTVVARGASMHSPPPILREGPRQRGALGLPH